MFNYPDTQITSELTLNSGAYYLASSDRCYEERRCRYSLQFFKGRASANPYTQYCDHSIDFDDLAEILSQLEGFPEEDLDGLREWLKQEVV